MLVRSNLLFNLGEHWLWGKCLNIYLYESSIGLHFFPRNTASSHILQLNSKHARPTPKLFEYYKNFKPFIAPFFSRYKSFFTLTMATFSRTITQKTVLFIPRCNKTNFLLAFVQQTVTLQIEKGTRITLNNNFTVSISRVFDRAIRSTAQS